MHYLYLINSGQVFYQNLPCYNASNGYAFSLIFSNCIKYFSNRRFCRSERLRFFQMDFLLYTLHIMSSESWEPRKVFPYFSLPGIMINLKIDNWCASDLFAKTVIRISIPNAIYIF